MANPGNDDVMRKLKQKCKFEKGLSLGYKKLQATYQDINRPLGLVSRWRNTPCIRPKPFLRCPTCMSQYFLKTHIQIRLRRRKGLIRDVICSTTDTQNENYDMNFVCVIGHVVSRYADSTASHAVGLNNRQLHQALFSRKAYTLVTFRRYLFPYIVSYATLSHQ